MKYSDSFVIYISTQTTKGHRYIYYTASDTDKGMHENGTYIHHGLGTTANNGSWQTFTRDLEADLKEYESDNELLSINGFLIRGNGRVDDISTSSQVYEDAEQEKETQITYSQNALNQRVAKEVDGIITEKYLWRDLTTLLATYDKDDNLVQRFNYTNNRMPTSMTQDNQTYYLHYDQVGTLRVVTDINHNIIKEITYDTFGNILQDTNKDFKILFGFAGGLHDRDTDLVHFGYREYDPQTGKWTAKDPIDFSGGDSNLYGYVESNPVNLVDPSGLVSMTKIGLGVWSAYELFNFYNDGKNYKDDAVNCINKNKDINTSSPDAFDQYLKNRRNLQNHLSNTREYGKKNTTLPGGRY